MLRNTIGKIIKFRSNQKIINSFQTKTITTTGSESKMVDNDKSHDPAEIFTNFRSTIPDLTADRHKGQSGRIGIVGGSFEYTGAPYFAAISAMKCGADLSYVFCSRSSAPIIKSYSPELIVLPLLDEPNGLRLIEPWLERLHVLVIGPGLGRDPDILSTVSELIKVCRQRSKLLVIDADGLFLLSKKLLTDDCLITAYPGVILTPNAMEFSLLFGNDPEGVKEKIKQLGTGVTIIKKGTNDRITTCEPYDEWVCPTGGSGRRCGGQGDLLSGAIATFLHWTKQGSRNESTTVDPAVIACVAGSKLAKDCNFYAFKQFGRCFTATDMINQIPNVFNEHFEAPTNLE